jgi:RHS repeat-associated protein
MKMKSTIKIAIGVFVLTSKILFLSAQSNISYIPFYTQSTFNSKTIDKSKAFGVVLGSADVVNGAATYSIPIASAPRPEEIKNHINIALNYTSQASDQGMGRGWGLSGLSAITRVGKSIAHNGFVAPICTSEDEFTWDGNKLIKKTKGINMVEYWKTESETFSEIQSSRDNNGRITEWVITAKDGTKYFYGGSDGYYASNTTTNNINCNVPNGGYIYYYLDYIQNTNNLITEFDYYFNNNEPQIKSIHDDYTHIIFNYKNRLDKNVIFYAGRSIEKNMLLDNIEIRNNVIDDVLIRKYNLKYSTDSINSFLSEIEEVGLNNTKKNSTIFYYGERNNATSFVTKSGFFSYPFPAQSSTNYVMSYQTGDFNGDGLSDIVSIDQTWTLPRYTTGYRVLINNGNNGYSQTSVQTGLSNALFHKDENRFLNFSTSDFNGDGIDDIVINNVINSNNTRQFISTTINYFDNTGNVSNTQTLSFPISYTYSQFQSNNWDRVHSSWKFFYTGDFDGDGATDFIILTSNGTTSFKAFISYPSKNIYHKDLFEPYSSIMNNWVESDEILVVDMDGDGKSDIMTISGGTTKVFSINESIPNYYYMANVIYSSGYPTKWHKVIPGDFNGDGKTDLLSKTENGGWNIGYSTGNSFNEVFNAINFLESPIEYNQYSGSNHFLRVADFNGDGKTDIIHTYKLNGYCNHSIDVYYSQGKTFHRKSHNSQNANYIYLDKNYWQIIGDFNGDGKSDLNASTPGSLVSVDYGCHFSHPTPGALRMHIYFDENGKELVINKIKNGFGSVAEYNYNTLSKLPITRSYNGTNGYNGNLYYKLPFNVVTNFKNDDNNIDLSYDYYGAMLNKKGRGFLGYRQIKITDNKRTGEITNIFQNKFGQIPNWNDLVYVDNIIKTKSSQILEEKRLTYNNAISNATNSYKLNLEKQVVNSYFSGNSTTEYEYDNFGNLTLEKKLNADGYLTEKIIDYGNTAANRPSLPASTIVNYKHNNKPTISYQTNYEYTPLFQLKKKTEFPNLANPIISEYKYDWRGNITESSVKGNNMPLRKTEFVYDADNLFLSKKKNSIGQEEIYEIDRRFNKPTKITGIDGLSTSFVYDPFGNLTTTLYPDNTSKTSYIAWASNPMPVECVYTLAEWSTVSPLNIIGFDKNNKKIIEYSNEDSKEISKSFFYDSRNRLFKTTTKEDQAVVSQIENQFDDYDRPINTLITGKDPSISLTTNNITYTKSSNFWEITESTPPSPTNPSGSSQYKKVSLAGELLETEQNNVNKLTYNYDAEGKNTKIIYDNIVVSEIKYDPYGRKMELIDNSAAKQKYEYNSLGELSKQTNANNGFVRYEYDVLGRKTKEILNEGTILYNYFPSGSGAKTNKIKQIKNYNNAQEDFDYDPLGRLIEIKTRILGLPQPLNTVSKQITYNALNQIDKIKTPTGNIYEYFYTSSGALNQIQKGGQNIYEVLDKDAFGNPITIKTGNQSIQYEYDNWLKVNKIQSPFIHDEYTWDPMNGNLMTKNEIHHNFSYTYSYDQFEQMTNESLNNAIHNPVNYNPNGNIKDKFSVNENESEYIYHSSSSKMFAVKNIYDLDLGDFSGYVQSIVNNSSNRPTKITQGNYRLEMSYDHSQDRATSFLYHNNIISNKRYYFGNSEMNFDKNNILKYALDYIYAGDQLVAIDYKDHTNTNKLHYVHQDYLGNIRAVFDDNNNAFYQNFDAWGNWRETNDPNHLGAIRYEKPSTLPEWLSRGYTTHEHLREFRLINMNARLYDPNIGRMLSPDNYATDNTIQGFNRYTYAHNNPVKFTDPDGNLPLLAVIGIGAGIGAYFGGTMANNSLNPFQWNYNSTWKSIVAGGMAGGIGAGVVTALPFGGFTGGAISGGAAGFTNSATLGFYNLANNNGYNWGNFFTDLGIGTFSGALAGGLIGGTLDALQGRNFWDGKYAQYSMNDRLLAHNANDPTLGEPSSESYVWNNSDRRVYFKPENRQARSYDFINPNSYLKEGVRVDGVATKFRADMVFKIPDGTKVNIIGDGRVFERGLLSLKGSWMTYNDFSNIWHWKSFDYINATEDWSSLFRFAKFIR